MIEARIVKGKINRKNPYSRISLGRCKMKNRLVYCILLESLLVYAEDPASMIEKRRV